MRRPSMFVFIAFVVTLTLPHRPLAQDTPEGMVQPELVDPPLILSTRPFKDGDRSIEARLENTGRQAATAWAFKSVVTFDNRETSTSRAVMDVSGGEIASQSGFEGLSESNRPLVAGASRALRIPVSSREGRSVTKVDVMLTGVVLENGKSWGSAAEVTEIFRTRKAALQQLRELKTLLASPPNTNGFAAKRSIANTRAVLQRFAQARQDGDSLASRRLLSIVEQVQGYVKQGTMTEQQADETIKRFVALQEAVTARHASPAR